MKRVLRGVYVKAALHPRLRRMRWSLAELRRRLLFRPHVVRVFLQLDDPYSYLLSYYLQFLAKNYRIRFDVHLSQALRGDFAPQPALQAEYAIRDCRVLSRELGVPFLDVGDVPVVEHRRLLLDFLAEEEGQDDYREVFHEVLGHYWRGNIESTGRLISKLRPEQSETNVLIAKNQLLLRKLGHYNSAMLHYAGEWYWGIDRLPYLVRRLDSLGARKGSAPVAELVSLDRAMTLSLPAAAPTAAGRLPPLEMYHSFRSPYSYLALRSAFAIADAFGIDLDVRPVLPMVMRGLRVPVPKLKYILKDADREARRLNIPFGKPFDPVGDGVERCLAVLAYAKTQGKAREFLLSVGEAIWAEGVDVRSEEGMRHATERSGLFWPEVAAALQDDGWKHEAEANRESLTAAGLWGVPTFVIGDLSMWGRDRDWLLARQLEDRCESGDGILV